MTVHKVVTDRILMLCVWCVDGWMDPAEGGRVL